jgi:hypothetical protein
MDALPNWAGEETCGGCEMTPGEERVRISFNPSAKSRVDQIKQQTADLIDHCYGLQYYGGDAERCAKEAQLAYEIAAMWAVKAATAKEVKDEKTAA